MLGDHGAFLQIDLHQHLTLSRNNLARDHCGNLIWRYIFPPMSCKTGRHCMFHATKYHVFRLFCSKSAMSIPLPADVIMWWVTQLSILSSNNILRVPLILDSSISVFVTTGGCDTPSNTSLNELTIRWAQSPQQLPIRRRNPKWPWIRSTWTIFPETIF